jgi:hypothetical protein
MSRYFVEEFETANLSRREMIARIKKIQPELLSWKENKHRGAHTCGTEAYFERLENELNYLLNKL